VGAGAVAGLIAKQKHIVDAFRRAAATSAASAVAPVTIDVGQSLAFRKLRQHAVLRETGAGLFYLDEPSWEALAGMRRRMALVSLLIVLFAAIVFWLHSR
jgi:hypothetical protein